MTHYSFGSGMVGCLYDYGPHFCTRLRDAIDSLLFVFGDGDCLEEGEADRMRANLRRNGIHYFEKPETAGAHYAQVTKHKGSCPKDDES